MAIPRDFSLQSDARRFGAQDISPPDFFTRAIAAKVADLAGSWASEKGLLPPGGGDIGRSAAGISFIQSQSSLRNAR